jgi:hypothetical protein
MQLAIIEWNFIILSYAAVDPNPERLPQFFKERRLLLCVSLNVAYCITALRILLFTAVI